MFGARFVRFGAVPCVLDVCTVTISVGAMRMSPCAPAPAKQREDVQSTPWSARAVAFCAVGGPASGLPCAAKLAPAFVVPMIRLFATATHAESFVHPIPFS